MRRSSSPTYETCASLEICIACRKGSLFSVPSRLIRVEAPLAEAQLIETALLNIVNYQTLIATKAARIMHVLDEGDTAMEFGSRRAQEMDAAIWGTRAAFIGGFMLLPMCGQARSSAYR